MSIFKLIKGGAGQEPTPKETKQEEKVETSLPIFPTPKGLGSLSDPLANLDEARQAVDDLYAFLTAIDLTSVLAPLKEKRPRAALETVKLLGWTHELRETLARWKQELATIDEAISMCSTKPPAEGGER